MGRVLLARVLLARVLLARVLLSRVLLASVPAAALAGCAPGGLGAPPGEAGPTSSPQAAPDGGRREVVVLAAASVAEVVEQVAADVEASTPGVRVTVVPGPSSGLAEQVLAGAPGDVLVAAAPEPVRRLVEAGEVLEGPYDVARNSPVLAVPSGNPGGVTGLGDLADPDLVVSLCEPRVPCGAVAAELLRSQGVQAAPDSLERDVRAVLTRLRLGEADAGIVYRTDVLAAGGAVDAVEVAGAEEVTTVYPAVVLAGATDPALASDVVAALRGPAGARLLAQAGFGPP